MSDFDLIVVGAGPVGSALALAFASEPKANVLLIDREPEVTLELDGFDTRVFAINQGSRQLLQSIGVWQDILNSRANPYQRMHVWDAEGTGSVTFAAENLGVTELGYIIEAGVIQNHLNQRVSAQENLEVMRPEQIERMQVDQQCIQLNLNSGVSLSADLLCAADGAQSSLRDMAGIDYRQEDCAQRALVANIKLELAHENCAWQIFRPQGPLAFLPLAEDSQRLCSIVWSLDTDEAQRIECLADDEFEQELQRAVESRFGRLQLASRRQSFPLVQRHSKSYTAPCLALVGDAAHSIHPLAGLGANLGFQDIQALCEEVSRARQRGISVGHPVVLDRYERRRKLDNELSLRAMSFFRTAFGRHRPEFNALRNLGLKLFDRSDFAKRKAMEAAFMS